MLVVAGKLSNEQMAATFKNMEAFPTAVVA
jgi:hypothetical protein